MITGFQMGSRQTGFVVTEGPQAVYILQYIVLLRTCCHLLPQFASCSNTLSHLPMKVHYGELRHFCDDRVCADPVWLSL